MMFGGTVRGTVVAGARRLAAGLRHVRIDGGDPDRLPLGAVILVANRPTRQVPELVLGRLDAARRDKTVVVLGGHEETTVLEWVLRAQVRVDLSDPKKIEEVLRPLLRAGFTLLVAPNDAWADLAASAGVRLIPVGVRGAHAVGVRPGPSVVSVRFGDPLPGRATAADQVAAQARLVAEDRETWWKVLTTGGDRTGADMPAEAIHWRKIWAQTADPVRGGTAEPRRIWR